MVLKQLYSALFFINAAVCQCVFDSITGPIRAFIVLFVAFVVHFFYEFNAAALVEMHCFVSDKYCFDHKKETWQFVVIFLKDVAPLISTRVVKYVFLVATN